MLALCRRQSSPHRRYESVGQEGYHSLFNWYRAFEAQHFPDPNGMRKVLARLT